MKRFRIPGLHAHDEPAAPAAPSAAHDVPTPSPGSVPPVVLKHERVDRLAGLAFLRTHAMGTMAFLHHERLVVEPVSCVLDPEFDEWLYVRALPGSVLAAEDANQRVAVSVRTDQSPTEWVMATVYGRLVPLTARGGEASPRVHARAVDVLQVSAPDLATASAESREEETLYRVSVDMLHARSCHAEVS